MITWTHMFCWFSSLGCIFGYVGDFCGDANAIDELWASERSYRSYDAVLSSNGVKPPFNWVRLDLLIGGNWNMTPIFPYTVLGISSSQNDELMFFRGVAIPPTSFETWWDVKNQLLVAKHPHLIASHLSLARIFGGEWMGHHPGLSSHSEMNMRQGLDPETFGVVSQAHWIP